MAAFGALPLMAAIVALAGAGLLLVDFWNGRSPRARLAARLEAVILRAGAALPAEAAADLTLFAARRRDLRGRLAQRLADLSDTLGGGRALWALAAIALAAAVGAATAAQTAAGLSAPLAAAAGLGAGFLAFRLAAMELRRRWTLAFLDQMVEAVELMSRSVRSGFTPSAAIRIVAQEVADPAGALFARIADEDELGLDMRASLGRAARQVGLPDFNFLTVALILQRESGGQLAETLETLHLMLRKRREARLKIQALTSEGRMSANILSALPFVAGVGAWLASPEQFLLLFTPGLGQTMVAIGGGLLVTGILVMRWMVMARA